MPCIQWVSIFVCDNSNDPPALYAPFVLPLDPCDFSVTSPVTFPAPTQVLGHGDFLGPRN